MFSVPYHKFRDIFARNHNHLHPLFILKSTSAKTSFIKNDFHSARVRGRLKNVTGIQQLVSYIWSTLLTFFALTNFGRSVVHSATIKGGVEFPDLKHITVAYKTEDLGSRGLHQTLHRYIQTDGARISKSGSVFSSIGMSNNIKLQLYVKATLTSQTAKSCLVIQVQRHHGSWMLSLNTRSRREWTEISIQHSMSRVWNEVRFVKQNQYFVVGLS